MSRQLRPKFVTRRRISFILSLAICLSPLYGFFLKIYVPVKAQSLNGKGAQDIDPANIPIIAPGSAYVQTNLISDYPGFALSQDPLLVNPWGITATASSPFWVANNGTSTTQLIRGDVGGAPVVLNPSPQTVTIPGGLPTGTVANGTSDFVITSGAASGPARFIFASITGNITGWNPNVPAAGSTTARIAASHPGHVNTGLAIGVSGGNNFLYAADFANGKIDVFNGTFTLQSAATFPFVDPTIPTTSGNTYHPFNIQNIGGSLYVTYAKVGTDGRSENGIGNGFVRRFNTSGVRDLTFGINNGPLDAPWGITIAPATFGIFGGALLVGNFSDNGTIHAFNPTTGAFLGTLQNEGGQAIVIDELWGLIFGNGGAGGDPNTLYFTAGTGEEEHGLFGSLKPTTASATSLIQFATDDVTIGEGTGHVDITVTRSGDVSGTATVNYNTFDEGQPGHASQKSDYEIALGKLTFAPGETSKTFRVLLVDDKFVEGNETINLFLSNPTGAGVGLGSQSTATLSINDNDAAPPSTNPIDDAQFFVRQHYLDLFNREPDAGFAALVNQITSCGSNASCINSKRVEVSTAFFTSNEFQGTGSLIIRTHKAAFGSGASGFGPGDVLYGQFELDHQAILKDVAIGAAGSAQLEANKQAFFAGFITRPQFVSTYPTTLTPTQFADALIAHAAFTPTIAERQAVIDEFGGAADTTDQAARTRALRRLAENATFVQRDASRDVVQLGYFTYLRRDPDTAGFNHLLNRLNSFLGDINQANMLRIFITIQEYRQRFGPDGNFLTNTAPVANGDTAATNTITPLSINVLANDTDFDGDFLIITSVTPGTGGTPVIDPGNRSVTFTPANGFTGTATFQYTITDNGTSSGSTTSDSDPKTASATVTITVTSAGAFQFSSSALSVSEGVGKATITVTRSGDTTVPVTVDFATVPDASVPNCATVNGHASERCDYNTAIGVLSFSPGDVSKTFDIFINDDLYVEGNETFSVALSNPKGTNFVLGGTSTVTVTITDNDSSPPAPSTNPLDTPSFFVRQHYVDFLNREPDPGGLAFWAEKITNCGSNTTCIDQQRVGVSSAFFLSQEFQDTGYFVYLLYRASFGGAAGTRPSFTEFTRDRNQLVVGSSLVTSKAALVSDFVTRAEFTSAYPLSFTSAQYVDKLNTNTGNSLTPSERDALVNGLENSGHTRATVLRAVVDNAAFRQKELNNAFVLMEYFGYLRRDIDAGGYAFWLNILNNTNNSPGMVCAFINSAEYQLRFSPVVSRNDNVCAAIAP